MVVFKRLVFYLMIPVDLLAVWWAWIGRESFGVEGWWVVFFTISVLPLLGLAFLVSSILAFAQRIPATEGHLTTAQAFVHLGLWVALFGFGFFVVEFTDQRDDQRSLFTEVVGRSDTTLDTSMVLWVVSGILAAVLYVSLVIMLIVTLMNRRSGRHAPGPYGHPPPNHPGGPHPPGQGGPRAG